jgi:hypothetical protein
LELKPDQFGRGNLSQMNSEIASTGIEYFSTFCMPQQNFATRFRSEIQSNPLITVILNATVNDISFTGLNAIEISAITTGGRKIDVTGKTFVFACGTIEVCRFFLSMQRTSDVPWKTNSNIGKYFQDHIVGSVAKVKIIDEQKFRDAFEVALTSGMKVQPKLRNDARFERPKFSGVVGSFAFSSQLQESFDNLKFLVRTLRSGVAYSRLRTLPADLWSLGGALYPIVARFLRHRRLMAFMDGGVEFVVQAEQIPIAESAVRLLDDHQQFDGMYRAAVNWKIDGKEMANIRDFTSRVDAFLRKNEVASLQIDDQLNSEDPSMLERFDDFYHQAGGMCMSRTASAGVVDFNSRVWGTGNVYVAGASVFPTSSHANVTLTALALTARLALVLEKNQ